jgi:hypothetical protein
MYKVILQKIHHLDKFIYLSIWQIVGLILFLSILFLFFFFLKKLFFKQKTKIQSILILMIFFISCNQDNKNEIEISPQEVIKVLEKYDFSKTEFYKVGSKN